MKANGTATRVAIFGGGPGGVATAFWLTSTPELRDQFDVTLWTRGWRLGGKGATGRNADQSNRIEEHGLHLWLGFYTNSFRTMHDAFAELGPNAPGVFHSVAEAFSPVYQAAFMERSGQGDPPEFVPWIVDFPPLPGVPGDPPSKISLLSKLLHWLHDHLRDSIVPLVADHNLEVALAALQKAVIPHADAPSLADKLLTEATKALLTLVDAGLGAVRHESNAAPDDVTRPLNRALILANLAVAFGLGYIEDIATADDETAAYEALDELEFRAWLRSHRAWEDTLACAPLQGIYDLAFAYPNGDASDPLKGEMAAGICIQLVQHMLLLYKDAPLWKMTAGMGETVFTPLYDVLVGRKVKINFFHALEDVAPTPDGNSIGRIRLRRQAELATPSYCPLVTVNGLRCWPSEPKWSHLVDGDELKARGVRFEDTDDTTGEPFELLLNEHFDVVVLAVPPDVLKLVTPNLRPLSQQWSDMLDSSHCIATQAFQLWLKIPSHGSGFEPVPPPPLTAYREAYATWADMSHLLPQEAWTAANRPLMVSYHCGPMRMNAGPPRGGSAQAESEARNWLRAALSGLWPKVADLAQVTVSEFFSGNTDPSERYALVRPGSIKSRIRPGQSPFCNLYVAGDWTRTKVSGGCFENAIQSGMMAAQAISKVQMPIDG